MQGHPFQFSSTGRESPAFMIYQPHLNCLVKFPTCRILFRKSLAFTSILIISCYDILSICTRSIYSLKIFKEGEFWNSIYSQFIIYLKLLWNDFFFVFTLNSKGGVLCIATVSEGLKMRKSLTIHYWQDTVYHLWCWAQ